MSLPCVLEQDTLILASTGSTQKDPSRCNSKVVDWDVKNQTNKKNEYVVKKKVKIKLYICIISHNLTLVSLALFL